MCADIFAGTQPPAWLQHMTAQTPGELGSIFGELVGGLADAGELAIATAKAKQEKGQDTNWIKELPGSIRPGLTEARLNIQDPLWRIKLQQAQLNMVEQQQRVQSELTLNKQRQQTLQMREHDMDALPQWLQDHPTLESRQGASPPNLFTPEGTRMFGNVLKSDAESVQHKAIISGISDYSKGVAKLQELGAPEAAELATNIGKIPTADMQTKLAAAMTRAEARKKQEEQAVPAEMTLPDGTKVQGWRQGNKFTAHKPDKETTSPGKLGPAEASELRFAERRALDAEKISREHPDDEGLKNQSIAARKFYNQKLREASEATKPKTPATAPPTKPFTPDTAASTESGTTNLFGDFQLWKSQR